MRKKLIFIVATLCIATLTLAACSSDDTEEKDTTTTTTVAATELPTIADVAAGDKDFSVLLGLVKTAGLVELLSAADGQFTVFAPTDDAFEKVDPDVLASLKGNKDALTQVLTYHAISGTIAESKDLEDGQVLTTASGGELTVGINDGDVTITDSSGNTVNVVKSDIKARNGVIHVIDGVLIPSDLAL
jgi:uncharacterized surface protein with fasciclin (FAS1) repeats